MDESLKSLGIDDLRSECKRGCRYYYMTVIDSLDRHALFNKLIIERLKRKNDDIKEIYDQTCGNWPQTLHILLFRMMGGSTNKWSFDHLARLATYNIIAREGSSLIAIEALLLGASGLLDLCPTDNYGLRLREEYKHLCAKYNIHGMSVQDWQLVKLYPNNHPILRLMQLASCYYYNTLSMHNVAKCTRRNDVLRLFEPQTSEYWTSVVMPKAGTSHVTRRIGRMKSDIIGINVVAQINHAFGHYIRSEATMERAFNLLKDIPAEQNIYINAWNSHATTATSALDSQALLQLSKEYCDKERCADCPFIPHLFNSIHRK